MNWQNNTAETLISSTDDIKEDFNTLEYRLAKKRADLSLEISQKYKSKKALETSLNEDEYKDTTPAQYESGYSFSILQEWEGYVVSISKDTFTARLIDVTNNSEIEDEEADFLLTDLRDSDREKICIGAIFRWIVGYHRSPSGTKDRSSRIKLRDNLPAWTKKELVKNQQDAIEWANALNKND